MKQSNGLNSNPKDIFDHKAREEKRSITASTRNSMDRIVIDYEYDPKAL